MKHKDELVDIIFVSGVGNGKEKLERRIYAGVGKGRGRQEYLAIEKGCRKVRTN